MRRAGAARSSRPDMLERFFDLAPHVAHDPVAHRLFRFQLKCHITTPVCGPQARPAVAHEATHRDCEENQHNDRVRATSSNARPS